MIIALWIVQSLLTLMFLFAGISKTFQPLPAIKKSFPWANHVPAGLNRFIGISELLAALELFFLRGDSPSLPPWDWLSSWYAPSYSTSLIENFPYLGSIWFSCFLLSLSQTRPDLVTAQKSI